MKPDDSNIYVKDWEQFDKDSSHFGISVDVGDQKGLGWAGGPLYKGGLETFKTTLVSDLEKNLPYAENGDVSIKIEADDWKHEWKTHPIYFKKYGGINTVFKVLNKAVDSADKQNQDYYDYAQWQAELEHDKNVRKGYYDDNESPEERESRKIQRSIDKKKERVSNYTDTPPVNSTFKDFFNRK